MKKIINKHHSNICFPDFELNMAPGETKEVSDEIFQKVISSPYIEEVKDIEKSTHEVGPKVEIEKVKEIKQ